MRIGLDIDNVITDFDATILEAFLEEDKHKRNKGIINPYARHITKGMFDWSKEEVEEFYCKHMEELALLLKPRKNAKYYMEKLLQDGHELYLISHRAYPHYNHPYETTVQWLKQHHIPYTKLILSKTTDKSPECLEHKIDIMFDDVVSNCLTLDKNKILVYLMATKYNTIYHKTLPIVHDWQELYEVIKEKCNMKTIILDTDMANEVDDQFALSYLMKSLDQVQLEAITIAPFSGSGYANTNSIADGTEKSYDITLHLLDLLGYPEYASKVYKGALHYTHDLIEENEASNRIIDIVLQHDFTTIIAIGAITNIAIAIEKNAAIIPKMEVIWLGGNSFLVNQNQEFNFRQDIQAVQTVFESHVKLTVIPCRNVASNLVTTSYELEHYLKGNVVGDYLCEQFRSIKKHYYTSIEEEMGSSKTLWDISTIAYAIHPEWFVTSQISCPIILPNGCYEMTENRHTVTFVNDLFRNKIFNDYFRKMGE